MSLNSTFVLNKAALDTPSESSLTSESSRSVLAEKTVVLNTSKKLKDKEANEVLEKAGVKKHRLKRPAREFFGAPEVE